MRIKFIADNEEERKILGDEPGHNGVTDVFIFGKEKDKDGDSIDFHFWKGSYQFLLGNLSYFSGKITDEQRMKMGMQKLVKETKVDANRSEEPQAPLEEIRPNIIPFPQSQEIKEIKEELETPCQIDAKPVVTVEELTKQGGRNEEN